MSDQGKSNVQAFGAGVMGFVAVMAIGGGALMVHRSQEAKSAATPIAAGEPIDLGSAMPRPSMSPAARPERREQSPAPLLGETEENAPEASSDEPSAPAAPSPEAAPKARSSDRLEPTRSLVAEEGRSSAVGVVHNTLAPEAEAAPSGGKAAVRRTRLNVEPAGAAAVASVHYGATSRSELMGRAAGPVYNIKGGARQAPGVTGELAGDTRAAIADIRRRLEDSGLPAEQRAKLEGDLDEATKGLSAPARAQ